MIPKVCRLGKNTAGHLYIVVWIFTYWHSRRKNLRCAVFQEVKIIRFHIELKKNVVFFV